MQGSPPLHPWNHGRFHFAHVNPAGATVYRRLATEYGGRVMEDGFFQIVLDGWHRHAAANILHNTGENP